MGLRKSWGHRREGLSTDIARFPKEKFENRHRGFEESIALL